MSKQKLKEILSSLESLERKVLKFVNLLQKHGLLNPDINYGTDLIDYNDQYIRRVRFEKNYIAIVENCYGGDCYNRIELTYDILELEEDDLEQYILDKVPHLRNSYTPSVIEDDEDRLVEVKMRALKSSKNITRVKEIAGNDCKFKFIMVAGDSARLQPWLLHLTPKHYNSGYRLLIEGCPDDKKEALHSALSQTGISSHDCIFSDHGYIIEDELEFEL